MQRSQPVRFALPRLLAPLAVLAVLLATPSTPCLAQAPSSAGAEQPSTEQLLGLRRAVERDLDNVELRRRFAEALMAAGKPAPAIDQLDEAIRRAPNDAVAHQLLGTCYRRVGKMDEALASYRRALELDDSLVQARTGVAAILASQGDLDGAIAQLDKLVQREPDNDSLLLSRGQLHLRAGHREKALQDLDKVVTAHPERKVAALERAQLQAADGDLEKAAEGLDGSVAAMKDGRERALLLFNQGNLYFRAGKLDRAADCYRKAATLAPEEADIELNLGSVLARQGDDEAAARPFARAVELADAAYRAKPTPGNAQSLALALAASGRFDEAVQIQTGLIAAARKAGVDKEVLDSLQKTLEAYQREERPDPAGTLATGDGASPQGPGGESR